ncbi:MAG: DAK2 domain-containing protein [Lachnospiraceae bacterium]|nr:DAK2 domain-containing protein [Lachnospiraceae bacterium]
MAVTTIDAGMLKRMFLAGARNLEAQKEWINELNVFPVPDGDTGTNMTLTIMSAVKEVNNLPELKMDTLGKAISSGSLRGARGNSGVILSQLFRGFTKVIRQVEVIDARTLSEACTRAVETAYKAVMKPKEGTILTVARGISEKMAEMAEQTEDIEAIAAAVLEHGDKVLAETPELLPVLKQAGVVDSGGQGLMQVLKGAYDALQGKEIDYAAEAELKKAAVRFGYSVSFIIETEQPLTAEQKREFLNYLSSIGDSAAIVSGDGAVKVEVKTNDPGFAIDRGLTFGKIFAVCIENVRDEAKEQEYRDGKFVEASEDESDENGSEDGAEDGSAGRTDGAEGSSAGEEPNAPRKEVGFIAVSVGKGMNEIFKGLGVDYIISGGQTMNPSTDDMLGAIAKVNADHIFILPNNSNIVLAAEQAKKLTKDKDIIVIPSKTVPQGITAIINYMPDQSAEDNAKNMTQEMRHVKSGEVTYAVRDTQWEDKTIHKDDIMGINDDGIQAVGKDIHDTSLELLRLMMDEESELISIYYGKDVTKEDAEAFAARVGEEFSGVDIEVNEGGQPIYYYLLSVE